MSDMNSKLNMSTKDCGTPDGNWFYYAARFFAYCFFYYFTQHTNEDAGLTAE